MKDNLGLECPCKKYKGVYGIKLWESGGSGTRPKKWYEKEGSKMQSHYQGGYDNEQKGGFAPCVPCAAAVVGTGPIGMGIAAAGACAYGAKKGYDYYDKCKTNKGKTKAKVKGKKTKGKKKGKSKGTK